MVYFTSGKKACARKNPHGEEEDGLRVAVCWPPFRSRVLLDEGGKEAWGAREEGVGIKGKRCSAGDTLRDKEVGVWGWWGKRDGARTTADGTGGKDLWWLGREGVEFGT